MEILYHFFDLIMWKDDQETYLKPICEVSTETTLWMLHNRNNEKALRCDILFPSESSMSPISDHLL